MEAGSSGPGGIISDGSFQSAGSGRPLPQVQVDSGSSMAGGVVCGCGRQVMGGGVRRTAAIMTGAGPRVSDGKAIVAKGLLRGDSRVFDAKRKRVASPFSIDRRVRGVREGVVVDSLTGIGTTG